MGTKYQYKNLFVIHKLHCQIFKIVSEFIVSILVVISCGLTKTPNPLFDLEDHRPRHTCGNVFELSMI